MLLIVSKQTKNNFFFSFQLKGSGQLYQLNLASEIRRKRGHLEAPGTTGTGQTQHTIHLLTGITDHLPLDLSGTGKV